MKTLKNWKRRNLVSSASSPNAKRSIKICLIKRKQRRKSRCAFAMNTSRRQWPRSQYFSFAVHYNSAKLFIKLVFYHWLTEKKYTKSKWSWLRWSSWAQNQKRSRTTKTDPKVDSCTFGTVVVLLRLYCIAYSTQMWWFKSDISMRCSFPDLKSNQHIWRHIFFIFEWIETFTID